MLINIKALSFLADSSLTAHGADRLPRKGPITCRARPLCHSPFAQHIDHGCREEEDHAQEGQHGYQGCLASPSSWFFLLFVISLFLICFGLGPSFQTKARRDNGGLPVLGELLVQGQRSRWKSGLLGALNQGRGACVRRCPLCGLGDPGTGLRQKFLVVEILPMTGPTLWRENKKSATRMDVEVSSSCICKVWLSHTRAHTHRGTHRHTKAHNPPPLHPQGKRQINKRKGQQMQSIMGHRNLQNKVQGELVILCLGWIGMEDRCIEIWLDIKSSD